MPRNLEQEDEVVIHTEGTPVPVRKYLKFQGDGVTSVTDDSGNERSVVAVEAGGEALTGGDKGYIRYTGGPYTISSASGDYVNAGSLLSSAGSTSWYDGTYSNPSESYWQFKEHGLYRYTLVIALSATAALAIGNQFGVNARVSPGTQFDARVYEHRQGVQIHRSHPTDASTSWRVVVSITDYFGPTPGDPTYGGNISVELTNYASMPGSVSNVYTETNISRIL